MAFKLYVCLRASLEQGLAEKYFSFRCLSGCEIAKLSSKLCSIFLKLSCILIFMQTSNKANTTRKWTQPLKYLLWNCCPPYFHSFTRSCFLRKMLPASQLHDLASAGTRTVSSIFCCLDLCIFYSSVFCLLWDYEELWRTSGLSKPCS